MPCHVLDKQRGDLLLPVSELSRPVRPSCLQLEKRARLPLSLLGRKADSADLQNKKIRLQYELNLTSAVSYDSVQESTGTAEISSGWIQKRCLAQPLARTDGLHRRKSLQQKKERGRKKNTEEKQCKTRQRCGARAGAAIKFQLWVRAPGRTSRRQFINKIC